MKLPRRTFLHLAAGAAALPAVSRIASAQTYPSRPVRLIVGFPAGCAPDIIARLMGQWLSERLGQPFVIENRPGAGSNIGTEAVVRAAPDGYTLLLVYSANAINATLYDNLNFNFIRDIAPVASVDRAPVRHGGQSIGSGQDGPRVHCLRQGQSRQDQHGVGWQRYLGPCLRRAVQGDGRHRHGSRPLSRQLPASDLLGGQVQVAFSAMPRSIEYIRAGKLRALAVTTATRSDVLPDIPTVGDFCRATRQAGGKVSARPRYAGRHLNKLNTEINAGLRRPKDEGAPYRVGQCPYANDARRLR